MAAVPRWSHRQLLESAREPVAVVCDPAVAALVADLLPWPQYADFDALPAQLSTLIGVGGGSLLDALKLARVDRRPELGLIAIASLWGSGAEASPVAVANDGERKVARLEAALAPDARVVLPELAASLPGQLALHGCGDAWSHALEGSLSPLAGSELRAEGAELIQAMLELGLGADPRWFDLSARACALQAQASVGLIHGIAHVLEGPLRSSEPTAGWGHARLCAIYTWPVLQLNSSLNSKWPDFCAEFGVDGAAVLATLADLHDRDDYRRTLPALAAHWMQVLRDPLSRSNSALVRRGQLAFFEGLGAP